MTDWHVHIGQWFDTYYNAENVFAELKAVGIDEVWFSSTTSCRYCKESFAVQNDAAMQETLPTAHELYELIRYEVQEALTTADRLGIKAHALYWVVPELHFSGATDVADAMEELPYEGFKIHPRGNPWHLEDKKTAELAEEVFAYAENNNKLVLVHCGEGIFELPTVFEPYIAVHSGCTVQLAHCRPLKETLSATPHLHRQKCRMQSARQGLPSVCAMVQIILSQNCGSRNETEKLFCRSGVGAVFCAAAYG